MPVEGRGIESHGLAADTILYNGKIITVDKDFNITEAAAIRDGRFIGVGANSEVERSAGPGTKKIDLKGRCATPGIVDSHTHPVGVGNNLLAEVQLSDIDCLEEIFDRLSAAQAKAKPGEWITTARNWYLGQVERRPTLAELDAVTPNNPLWLPLGGHEGFTNTLGMQLAGITKATPDPPGGIVYKDPKTGIKEEVESAK
jgi:predicted amidohydrolase YtcJ